MRNLRSRLTRLALLVGALSLALEVTIFSGVAFAAGLLGGLSLQSPLVIGVLQLVAGKIQKLIPNTLWDSRIAPTVNFILALFGYTVAPVAAHSAAVSAMMCLADAGDAPGLLSRLVGAILPAVLTTMLSTGAHSWSKNTVQLLAGRRA